MKRLIITLGLAAIASAALAQTTEQSSKLNTYTILLPGPPGVVMTSKINTYAVVVTKTGGFLRHFP